MSTEQPVPDPSAVLQVPAACKICRGQGIDLEFTDSGAYTTHIRTVHPDSLPPATATDAQPA